MLIPLDSLDILAIVDNEVDPMSAAPSCVTATGNLGHIGFGQGKAVGEVMGWRPLACSRGFIDRVASRRLLANLCFPVCKMAAEAEMPVMPRLAVLRWNTSTPGILDALPNHPAIRARHGQLMITCRWR